MVDPDPTRGVTPGVVFVCVKWVATRIEVDPVDGSVTNQPHDAWFSASDLAAVETALTLADGATDGTRPEVVAICVGPNDADGSLRDLIAAGVDRVVRVDLGPRPDPADQPTSVAVARAIAEVIAAQTGALSATADPATAAANPGQAPASAAADPAGLLVVCGDVSADRGSGSVPAFLADLLGASQALGLLELSGDLRCVRRLDGGRRELLSVPLPAVVSVEGSVARLRRASLASMVTSREAAIEVRRGELLDAVERPVLRPYRPRTRIVAPPTGDQALGRIEQLTGARTDRTPPRTVTAEPREAAEIILDQLREWGYEWRTD